MFEFIGKGENLEMYIYACSGEDLGSSRRRSRHNQLAVVEPLHIEEGRDEV